MFGFVCSITHFMNPLKNDKSSQSSKPKVPFRDSPLPVCEDLESLRGYRVLLQGWKYFVFVAMDSYTFSLPLRQAVLTYTLSHRSSVSVG